jgi:hypothetical protein
MIGSDARMGSGPDRIGAGALRGKGKRRVAATQACPTANEKGRRQRWHRPPFRVDPKIAAFELT